MSYEIVWDPIAVDVLRKLARDISKRIVNKVDKEIKENPQRYLERLVGEDVCKIRIGDYRLFVDLTNEPKKLYIRTIKHRREAYKKKN